MRRKDYTVKADAPAPLARAPLHYARLTDPDGSQAGFYDPFRQVSVSHDQPVAPGVLYVGMRLNIFIGFIFQSLHKHSGHACPEYLRKRSLRAGVDVGF